MDSSVLLLISAVILFSNVNQVLNRILPEKGDECNDQNDLLDWFKYGYDLTEFDLFDCHGITGKRQPLIKLRHCVDQITTNGESVEIPGNFYITRTEGNSSESHASFSEASDFANYLASIVGVKHDQNLGAFINSDEYRKIETKVEKNIVVQLTMTRMVYSIGYNWFAPGVTFNRSLTEMVKELPKKFQDNPIKLINLVKTFGTHYIDTIEFGASIRRLRSFDKQKWRNYQISDLVKITKTGFPSLVPSDIEECKITENDVFKYKHQYFDDQFFGVSPQTLAQIGYQNWTRFVPKNPRIVGVTLKPISRLFSGQLSTAIQQAIDVYEEKALLDKMYLNLVSIPNSTETRNAMTDAVLEEYSSFNLSNSFHQKKMSELMDRIQMEIESIESTETPEGERYTRKLSSQSRRSRGFYFGHTDHLVSNQVINYLVISFVLINNIINR